MHTVVGEEDNALAEGCNGLHAGEAVGLAEQAAVEGQNRAGAGGCAVARPQLGAAALAVDGDEQAASGGN